MAKPPPKPTTPATPVTPSADVETEVVLMRKVGHERFEVVTGTVKGPLSNVRVVERSVSLMVGRGTARGLVERLRMRTLANLGLTGGQ